MLIEKKSCGTILKINTFENNLDFEAVDKIDKKLLDFENKYSRFYLDNYLNKLNKS
jgi:hypothetical protein